MAAIKTTISLQNRLTFSYAGFSAAALGLLALVINIFTGIIFTALVRDNIREKSDEIVRSIAELYDPASKSFYTSMVETLGMHFVHEGYIVSIRDNSGVILWDARSCDMEQCAGVISEITERMERDFRISGTLQNSVFPLVYNSMIVGQVAIETYGPFFYSETEARFLTSINRILVIAGIVLIFLSTCISALLSRSIARPVLRAAAAARRIIKVHTRFQAGEDTKVRIPDHYRTRELAELSRSINELAEELENARTRQKRLTSDIAHELRTPLTCLRGNMEAMIDGVWEPTVERLESCHEEIMRLAALVDDLNTLTGLEAEAVILNKTEFDLPKLLQTAAAQFEAIARGKGIVIKVESDPAEFFINADYDRLKQVFINLISNAVKYTDSGAITLRAVKDKSQWEVSVADTGIGIAPLELPHVFERFYRSDKSRSRSTGGAGIGLSIAAAIIAAHNGNIRAESEEGKGSVFVVRV